MKKTNLATSSRTSGKRKLELTTEAVRLLSEPELSQVLGGGKQPTLTGNCY